jgi:hypothetical protein
VVSLFFDANGKQVNSVVYEAPYRDDVVKPNMAIERSNAWRFQSGRLLVKRDGKYGYLDESGAEVISAQFYEASDFVGDFAEVRPEAGKVGGIIDLNGAWVLPPNGPMGYPHLKGGYAITSTYPKGYLDKQRIIDLRTMQVLHIFARDSGYQELEIIGYGENAVLRVLRSGTEWVEDLGVCVLGLDGHVIGCGYADAADAGEGVIAVADAERRWGAIDHAGHVLFAPRYETGESVIYRDARMNTGRSSPFRFKGNYAEVRTAYRDRLPFYIDKTGREFRDVAAPQTLRTSR